MHAPSEEEQSLFRAGTQPAGQTPLPPTKLQRLRSIHFRTLGALERDYPGKRTIPQDQIIEVSVSVRLPSGEALGPFRMYNSSEAGVASTEMANGDPDFRADGGERFIGAVLGSVAPDETIQMKFALVIDGQPMVVVGATAKSDTTAEVDAVGGYRLKIKPVLRPFGVPDRYRGNLKRLQASVSTAREVTPINPDWPGPFWTERPNPPPVDLPSLANTRVTCGDWMTKFTNDPKVDVRKVDTIRVTVTFDGTGNGRITPIASKDAFAADAFPAGLAAQQARITQQADRLNYFGRSPTLADLFNLTELDQVSPALTWERIRREGEFTYRTAFFLRCTH